MLWLPLSFTIQVLVVNLVSTFRLLRFRLKKLTSGLLQTPDNAGVGLEVVASEV